MPLTKAQEARLNKLSTKIGCDLYLDEWPEAENKPLRITGNGILEGAKFYIKDTDSEEDFEQLLELIYDTAEAMKNGPGRKDPTEYL